MKQLFLLAARWLGALSGCILADAKPVAITVMPRENLGATAEYDGLREGLADRLRSGLEGKWTSGS